VQLPHPSLKKTTPVFFLLIENNTERDKKTVMVFAPASALHSAANVSVARNIKSGIKLTGPHPPRLLHFVCHLRGQPGPYLIIIASAFSQLVAIVIFVSQGIQHTPGAKRAREDFDIFLAVIADRRFIVALGFKNKREKAKCSYTLLKIFVVLKK
jgi:hypothetical protein